MNLPVLARDLPSHRTNESEILKKQNFVDSWRRKILPSEHSQPGHDDEGKAEGHVRRIRRVNFADEPNHSSLSASVDPTRTLTIDCIK